MVVLLFIFVVILIFEDVFILSVVCPALIHRAAQHGGWDGGIKLHEPLLKDALVENKHVSCIAA